MKILDVFIVGAGMCGLTLLQCLQQSGATVEVTDKARGSGGRLSSKRIQLSDGTDISFDLGASAFKANSPAFRLFIEQQIDQGHAAHYIHQHQQDYYVGVPRNSAITRSLVNSAVAFSTRISKLHYEQGVWHLYTDNHGEHTLYAKCRQLVLAIPPEQALALLHGTHLENSFTPPFMQPQWVMMLATELPLNVPPYSENIHPDIALISYENSKPQRNNQHGLHVYAVQASCEFSQQHIDAAPSEIANRLLGCLQHCLNMQIQPVTKFVHRWLYSQTDAFTNGQLGDGLWLAGDYCQSPTQPMNGLEAAYLNALSLSKKIKLQLVSEDESYLV